MQLKKEASLRLGVITALLGALIFIVTAYVLHIPTPATGGYIHLGDAFVYIAASLLPAPYAVTAAGIGEGLSDALTGSIAYAPFTFAIKAAMALCFTSSGETIITRRNAAASAAAGVICIGGYYLTEAFMLHSFVSPVAEIPGNAVQATASAVVYLILGRALDGAKLKKSVAAFVK